MPAYHCGAEIEAVHLAGCEIDFYAVDANLQADPDDLARAAADAQAVYLISCFGFPPPQAPPGARIVVVDAAHGLFSLTPDGPPLGEGADATIFCPRKSLGVADGGALLVRDGAPPVNPPGGMPPRAAARSFASLVINRMAAAPGAPLRAAARRVLGAASVGDAAAREGTLTETVIGEWGLEPADLDVAAGAPAPLTRWLSLRADGEEIRARRRRHFKAIVSGLGDLAELVPEPFRELPDGTAPLYVPIRAADRDRALVALLDGGVRALEIWPVPHPLLDRDRHEQLEPLRSELVALPVHQTLRSQDLEAIVAAARRALG
jgi:dTDP-4-amino-4,6-dideoxygalactose transaminase